MNAHLSEIAIVMLQARTLPPAAMMEALDHLTICRQCRQRSHEHFQATNEFQASTITLAPVFPWQSEHLAPETVTAFVEQKLATEEQSMAAAHLQVCTSCRAEMQFQTELSTDLHRRYSPQKQAARRWQFPWHVWLWKPIFATVLVAVCTFVTLYVLSRPRQQPSTATAVRPVPSPANSLSAVSPSAAPTMSPTPAKTVTQEPMIASLQDQRGVIGLTSKGELTGLPEVAAEMRSELVAVLRTATLHKPAILTDLANESAIVRGNPAATPSGKLIAPVGITVLADRPLLRWQPMAQATGYEIQIADGRGNEIAKSAILPATQQSWQPTTVLPRGVIYSWTVRPIFADPATATPYSVGRFKVLETAKVQELERLKQQANSHFLLGMFYGREGMIPEAKHEFKLLANQNPDSPSMRKVLRTIQTW